MPTIFWLWLGAAVVFLIIEITTPGLVFLCFTVGAVAAAVTSTFNDSYLIQLGVFAVIPIILIPLTRPLAHRLTKPSPQPTNVDAMLGQVGIVTKAIDPDTGSGMVKVEGQDWRALAEEVISEGTKVRVVKVHGAKLIVARLD